MILKTFLANCLSTFFTKGNPIFSNDFKRLRKNPPDCHILYTRVFDNFILAEDPFAKALRSLETGVLLIITYAEIYSHH